MIKVNLPNSYTWKGKYYHAGIREVPTELADYLNLHEIGKVTLVHRDVINHRVDLTPTVLDVGFQLKEYDKLFINGRFSNDPTQGSTCWVPIHAGTEQRALLWVDLANVFAFNLPNPLTTSITVRRVGEPTYTIIEIEIFRPYF